MPNYTYRVYNGLTGHEYGDVDSLDTAEKLRSAIYPYPASSFITIDLLVEERADA